jgi:gamma-glutamylaminecyclotransferase
MVQKVFVFGTLKRSFPLHQQGLAQAIFLGLYRTRERYPLLIAGPWFAPMMFNEPGVGLQVSGELYEICDSAIGVLDWLESVGKPGNFQETIVVEPAEGGACAAALVYMKARELATPVHSSHLASYDDKCFISFKQRRQSWHLAGTVRVRCHLSRSSFWPPPIGSRFRRGTPAPAPRHQPLLPKHYPSTRHSWMSWSGATSSNVTSTAAPTGTW